MRIDRDALFREAYESGKDATYGICCHVRDPEDGNDAIQEVIPRLHRHIGFFQGGLALKTWICRIIINTCLDFQRSRRRHEKIPGPGHGSDPKSGGDLFRYGDRSNSALDIECTCAYILRLPVIAHTLVSCRQGGS